MAWRRPPAPWSSAGSRKSAQRLVPGTYIGKGKLEELKECVQADDADVVIFDNDLSPSQGRNLEKAIEVKVLDRSELILDIFATRARSVEAKLQVELAQLEYSLPRLRKMWTHLSRYTGGIGLRGPGETQLEEDRRLVAVRIRDLKQRLDRRAGTQGTRGRQPARGAHRLAGRLHQRRQEHAHERADRRRRPTPRTSSSPRSTRRTRQWRLDGLGQGASERHGRLHSRFAAPSHRLVQGDARRSPPGQVAACTSSMPAIPAPRSRSRPSTTCSRNWAATRSRRCSS